MSDKFSLVLRISDRNLVLFSESKTSIWSANWTSSSTSASIHSLLLDSGNFVLLKAGSTSEFLWQSFDFPTHTWLPGSRLGFSIVSQQTQILTSWKSYEDPAPGLFSLNPGSTANHMLWNRSTQYWTSGLWNESSNSFSLVPQDKSAANMVGEFQWNLVSLRPQKQC